MTKEVEARLKISAVDKTGQVWKTLSSKMGEVEKRAAAMNRQQSAFAKTSEGMAVALGRYLGPAAVGAGLVYVTKQAANFEESLTNIAKKSSASTEQMAKMRAEILGLGHEMPASLDEIAKGFERGAAAGLPLDQLRDFAKLSVMVADAWDTSSENAANFFSGFHASMGVEYGDQMKAYASLINDLADSGIADETGIADFIDRAGSSLKNFGMTPQEIAAYGAAMLNLKMPADVASRAMDTLTSKLTAPENLSPKSRTALKGIVGDLGQFRKMTGDKKMTFFLDQLAKLSGQQKASLLGGLLGEGFDDEIARLVNGIDEVRRNLALAHKETEQASHSVDKVYAQRMALFNSQLKVLQTGLNELAVRVGDKVLPGASGVLKGVNKMMADDDARGVALQGVSPEEEHKNRLEYVKRWRDLHPDASYLTAHTQGVNDYLGDLASVGRGDISDVFDKLSYAERLKFLNDKYANWPDESRHQPLRTGHGYTTSNLPKTGPTPLSRPSVFGDNQAAIYGEGQQGLRDVPTYSAEVNHALDQLRQLPGLADHIDEGGKKAADAIGQSGERAGGAVSKAGDSLAGVLLEIVAKLQGLDINPKATGPTGRNTPPVNADLGRSMPPSVLTGGGGGF